MKIKLDKQAFNQGLERLKLEYKILAPVTTPFKGTYSDTDLTKYEEIENIEDIEFNKKSNLLNDLYNDLKNSMSKEELKKLLKKYGVNESDIDIRFVSTVKEN